MKHIISIIVVLLSLLAQAQNESYEQLEETYNELKERDKKDSLLLVARQMNEWALRNEGDTSFRYAVSFRYVGNGFSDADSSLFYYIRSISTFDYQRRTACLDYALCLFNIGVVYKRSGNLDQALDAFLKSYETFNSIKQTHNPYFLRCIDFIASFFWEKEEFTRAEPYYLQALDIKKKSLGEDHPDYYTAINNLGVLYYRMGEYAKAEPYYQQSLRASEIIYGERHPNYARSLNNVGLLYFRMGEFGKAELSYQQALDINIRTHGKDHPDYVSNLNMLGVLNYEMGDYSEAEPYYLQSLQICEKINGEGYSDCAKGLNNLGLLYWKMGNYSKAEAFYQKCLNVCMKSLGEEHPDYSSIINNLGTLYLEMGEYEKAVPYCLQALDLYGDASVKKSTDYAKALNNLGLLYWKMGEYLKAEPFYLQSLDIYSRVFGNEHPDYAMTLNNLGLLYWESGQYSKAEIYELQSLDVFKQTLGEEHPDYASSLMNLGILYRRIGEFSKAEANFLKSLDIYKRNIGEEHPDYARALNNLGNLYMGMGEFAKAEAFNIQCLEIREKALGMIHPDYAMSLNNLGVLYWEIGAYEKAESYYLQSVEIYRNIYGEKHPDYAESLINLGLLYSDIGQYRKAAPYYLQSLGIYEMAFGKEHPDYALILNNLGTLYFEMGEYMQAVSSFQQSLEIWMKTLGEKHSDYATSLSNFGIMSMKNGEYAIAESLFLQSLEIRKKSFGEANQDYISSLNNLGIFYSLMDNLKLFEENYLSYFTACQAVLRKNASLSSTVKCIFKENYVYELYQFLSYLSHREDESSQIQLAGFNHWLFLNGWISDRDALLNQEIAAAGDTVLAVLYEDYRMQRMQLSEHYELTMHERAKRGIDIEKEEQAAERMESELAVKMKSFKRINAVYDLEDLREQIKSDEAYVDILRVPYFDHMNGTWLDSSLYMAYVVTSDTEDAPVLINMGDGELMEKKIFTYLMGQITESRATTMDGGVYDYLWKPLEASLEGKRHIYLSSGGIYHNLNLETIYHAESGKFLCEEKDIHLVSSGRAFVDQRLYGSRTCTDQTAFLMGSPDFEATVESTDQEAFFSPAMTYATMRDLSDAGTFKAIPLPATLREVESIGTSLSAANWDVELYTGVNASEDQLKKISSPRILHMATHGFFMEDIEQREETSTRMLGMDRERVAENPLLRSGLLLAGCNRTFEDSTLISGGDNGILTAYEAGLLNLRNTDLVVLSACETGRGEVRIGEGVHGLRKAMTDAGAQHILMSLWKVDDRVTSEYMQTFYGHYAQGKSIRESYNLTRNEIKQKYPQPYYWGAFVLVGE
jgi:tetratricopeptide (TPR) repeat protein